ncbi:MAG: GAF domain-containing protein [Cuniculiplasma sp.]
MNKNQQEQLDHLKSMVSQSAVDFLNKFCEYLANQNPKYNWVGIYVLRNGKLFLESFKGKPTIHTEINLGDGLCSMAILKNSIINEPDVNSNSEYLACSLETKSELVIPIRMKDRPIGEIDIDSDTKNAFTHKDEDFLSEAAKTIEFFVAHLSDINDIKA